MFNKTALFLSLLFLCISCATYKSQWSPDFKNWKTQQKNENGKLVHTMYLIGDAGNSTNGNTTLYYRKF